MDKNFTFYLNSVKTLHNTYIARMKYFHLIKIIA